MRLLPVACAISAFALGHPALWASDTVLLVDDFEREESDLAKEQVGNGWETNSRSRAKGVKQVDLVDGAMRIERAAVADHGVSVTHEVAFKDATVSLRFKLEDEKDTLGINIADMNEKSVHAGHICMALISLDQLQIRDLKSGRMDLQTRVRRTEDKQTAADKQRIMDSEKTFGLKLEKDTWYELEVEIAGETMAVSIDGKEIGTFASAGIDHPTKSRLRLAVGKVAWVDDVKVVRHK